VSLRRNLSVRTGPGLGPHLKLRWGRTQNDPAEAGPFFAGDVMESNYGCTTA